jgi:hypothetical protein
MIARRTIAKTICPDSHFADLKGEFQFSPNADQISGNIPLLIAPSGGNQFFRARPS